MYCTLLFKIISFFLKEINIYSARIHSVVTKTFIMLQKISTSNKCCSLELYSSKNPEKILILTLIVFNIDNNNNNFLSIKSAY